VERKGRVQEERNDTIRTQTLNSGRNAVSRSTFCVKEGGCIPSAMCVSFDRN
jgi:hypothetical protein